MPWRREAFLKFDDARIDAIEYMYARGVPLEVIAEMLGFHRNTVWKYIRDYDLRKTRTKFLDTALNEGAEMVQEAGFQVASGFAFGTYKERRAA